MEKKYDPECLFFYAALLFESDSKISFTLTSDDPVSRSYEILIEIKDSNDWFKINIDDKYKYLLSRGSEKEWHLQNLNELEKEKNKLGKVVVKREGKLRKEYHKFDLFWNQIKPGNLDTI